MLTFYEFTEEDLKSNRSGFITPRQQEWVKGFAQGISSTQRSTAKIAIVSPFLGALIHANLREKKLTEHGLKSALIRGRLKPALRV